MTDLLLPRPEGIVFDMDGLLLDTERVYFQAFRRTLGALGLPPDDDTFRAMVGTNNALGRKILMKGLAGRVTLDDFNKVWDADIAAAMADGIPAKPDVRDAIGKVKTAGVPYVIATSTRTEKAHLHLKRAGLGDLFDTIIGGDQVSASKPAPDIYLKAVATLSLRPHQCAAFEDSENGVRAAHAAGLTTIQIPDVVPPSAELRAIGHHIAPDLATGLALFGF